MEGNDRPIMSLVGQVMKAVNRRGDPVVIKTLLTEQITSKKAGSSYTRPVGSNNQDGGKQ